MFQAKVLFRGQTANKLMH